MRLLLIGNFLSATTGTRGACEDLADQLETAGWSVIRTSTKPGRLARLADIVATILLRRHNYVLAHVEVYSGLAFGLAEVSCWLLRLLGKPVVLTLHGGDLPAFAVSQPRRMLRLLTAAAVVTTPSHMLQQTFARMRPDIRYIVNGLDLTRYPWRPPRAVSQRLCWLRAFHSNYDPAMAVATVKALHTEFPNVHLTMYGPDKRDGSLRHVEGYIRQYGLETYIAIPGAIPKREVPSALVGHDIFLNTTRLESFGVCVAEAAACGLPVISTNVGELPYLWKDGEEVLLVSEGDADAMALAVQRILIEPGLAEKLSSNARAKVEQFDWNAVLPQWQELFHSLQKGKISHV